MFSDMFEDLWPGGYPQEGWTTGEWNVHWIWSRQWTFTRDEILSVPKEISGEVEEPCEQDS